MQVLQRRWDPTFSEHSCGFRPGRSAHQAVAQAQTQFAADYARLIDLEKLFDRVQSLQIEGSARQAGRGQTAAEAHSGNLECRGEGERVGQSKRAQRAGGSSSDEEHYGDSSCKSSR